MGTIKRYDIRCVWDDNFDCSFFSGFEEKPMECIGGDWIRPKDIVALINAKIETLMEDLPESKNEIDVLLEIIKEIENGE